MWDHAKIIGLAILAFGLGILAATFLPNVVLIVLEALVILSAGIFFFAL